MSNVQSYNALIDRFHAFASGHFILKRFSHGQIEVSDLEKFGEYPFMHVVPSNVTYAKGMKTFSFQIVLADLPRDKEDKTEYQREVLSDLQRIAEDLVAEITNHRVLFGDLITVQNVSLEPFLEEFQHTLTGWTISLDLLVPYYWDACSIPAEWNDMWESSTGGTGSILTFTDSITRDENGFVRLVNDEETPAPNYYYGTDDEGVRGWYLTTDNIGLTCETIGDCQTIIDIEAAIDALEEEILLKADITSISAVGFSNNYNDLDNLPTIPAAQVNSDWNAVSGVAEILNKPTLPSTVGDMLKSVYDTDVDGVVDSAERIQIVVRNSTGVTLTKGQIVYLSGATGNRPNAVLAQADTEATSSKTIGMVIANIANNADGQVAVNGSLHDLDLSAFTAGDTLWLSATTAGGMVANTPPIEPNHAVFIGYVARAHPTQGRIVLAIQNGYELNELHGVLITTPANNEALIYESSTSLWKNKTIATALGYTPVPETRTLTINGTTQDLSANRTFTIATGLTVGTTPITSGTVGRVLFEGTGNVLQQSGNLFWDNTNNRLGIGTASPTQNIHISGSTSPSLYIQETSGFTAARLITSSTFVVSPLADLATYSGVYATNNGIFVGGGYFGVSGYNSIRFFTTASERARIFSNGNFAIGTTTDAGYKLDVNGTTRLNGSTTFGTLGIGTGMFWDNTNNRLGIGNSAPTYNLDIVSGSSPNIRITRNGATEIRIGASTLATGGLIGTYSASPLIFLSNSVESMRLFTTGNVAIGTTTDVASSKLTIESTTQGFLPPRMTTTQKNAIATPAAGLVVYDTTLGKLCVRGASAWETITSV
jgi:hypothetical protein